METKVKKGIFIVIILMLILPLLQFKLEIISLEPLKGDFKLASKPGLTKQTWFANTYQQNYDKYFEDHIGFRNFFVRLNNQILYSLFKKANVKGVIVGKNNFLFEEAYIKSLMGVDYIGEKTIKNRIRKIKAIKDELINYNTKLLVVLAPGKASYYPEYVPSRYERVSDSVNYKMFVRELEENDISFIDYNKYFISNKNKLGTLLYPKTGIHWSDYAVRFVMDSIISAINTMTGYDMPKLIATINDTATVYDSKTDMDIEKSMNLLFDIEKPEMKYFNISFKKQKNTKPDVIVIGDSFYWQIFNTGISTKEFKSSEFWYYYKVIYGKNRWGQDIKNIDVFESLKHADIVILLSNEPNLVNFPWGFENINEEKIKHQNIDSIINNIKNDAVWFDAVRKKALRKNISVDSMLYMDALFILKQNK